jgi:hypothetical protein
MTPPNKMLMIFVDEAPVWSLGRPAGDDHGYR